MPSQPAMMTLYQGAADHNNNLTVIAVCGPRRSGKDAVSDFLVAEHGFTKIRFADPLKDMVRAAFGFTGEQVEGPSKDAVDARYGVSPRRVMQFLGTEVMQLGIEGLLPGMGRRFWARRLVHDHILSSRESKTTRMLVISDLRFPHEREELAAAVAEIRDAKLYIWRVSRNRAARTPDDVIDAHCSEQEFLSIPIDEHLTNDGSLSDLQEKVATALRRRMSLMMED
jgi:hypothetical protein